jgi:hypothetical protein
MPRHRNDLVDVDDIVVRSLTISTFEGSFLKKTAAAGRQLAGQKLFE